MFSVDRIIAVREAFNANHPLVVRRATRCRRASCADPRNLIGDDNEMR